MPIKLYSQNEEVYIKVKEMSKVSNRVAIVRPTGTGKMHIALKFLEENKEKRALYVAPSNTILHDVKKNIFSEGMTMTDFPNLRRITYQKLAKLTDEEIEKLEVDIIILDEFHHCGAPEWGKGVKRLLQRNSNAFILGLSATPLRYYDGLRDMADELFYNNVASEMTLEEAIEQEILPEATYVTSLYGYGLELENMQKNINRIGNKEKREKAQALFNTLSQKLDENMKHLPELFSEYIKNKNGKYIVFCKSLQDMEEKMKKVDELFGSVNPTITVRYVSSHIKENDRILNEFENDDDENTLKLLFAVDMLNEGYHVKDLDGVIMMRPTYSPTLYTQQIGRALTIGGSKRPVIIDLVNNFDTCRIIEEFSERVIRSRGNKMQSKVRLTRDPISSSKLESFEVESRFSIFDKTKEFREIAYEVKLL